jgi:hypothetical protein
MRHAPPPLRTLGLLLALALAACGSAHRDRGFDLGSVVSGRVAFRCDDNRRFTVAFEQGGRYATVNTTDRSYYLRASPSSTSTATAPTCRSRTGATTRAARRSRGRKASAGAGSRGAARGSGVHRQLATRSRGRSCRRACGRCWLERPYSSSPSVQRT